jgi:alpha-ribazole phosphatase
VNSFALHLMRHGAPQTPGLLLGHSDTPPDPDAMQPCVERARAIDFAQVLSSDLSRASSPAALIAAERAVPHHADARWRELHFGAWEGADPANFPASDIGRFWDAPDENPPPGGERWSDLRLRVESVLAAIDQPTLILSHAGAMRAALTLLCGFTYRQSWAIDLPYGALLSLRVWPEMQSAQISGLIT